MHLFVSLKSLLEEFLGINYTKAVIENLSKIADLSTRQIRTYVKRGEFSPGIGHKLKYRLMEQGVSIPDESYDRRFDIPIEWKKFFEAIKKKEDDFLPRTYRLIQLFADKDIEFIKLIKSLPQEDRFSAWKKYLTDEIVPLYCLNPSRIADMVRNSKDEKELKQPLYRIFLESLLYLISFAEAEYINIYSPENISILSQVLPAKDTDNTIISPSMRFFQEWMKTLKLDKDGLVQEMIDHFGEAGMAASGTENDDVDAVSREGLKKSLSRYLKGEIPIWPKIEKLVKGLHGRAMEIQGRNDDHIDYSQQGMDIYGGVRILDKLYHVACEVLPAPEVLEIISTYPTRYAVHTAAIKKEASV